MSIRILHIIPTFDRSGAEKQLMLLAAGLPRDRFDVHVCALTRGGPLRALLEDAGVATHVVGKRFRFDPVALVRLARHIGDVKPDLVHTWLFAGNTYGRVAARWARVPKVIAAERCVDPWKSEIDFIIDRFLARRTDRIATNTSAIQHFYARRGIAEDKFTVIPNAVPPPPPSKWSRPQLCEQLDLPQNARILGLIGRLWPQKRIKDGVWAADLLKVIRDDVHLLVIGDGPQRARLEKFRDQCRIRDKVHFLGHRADVADMLPHFDVLWSTSEYEGQSNAILEAMAAGVPVVATDVPGTRDLVIDDVTGYLVGVGDRAAFCRVTHRLLEDELLARRLGEAGRARADTEFSVEAMVQRYQRLYEEVTG